MSTEKTNKRETYRGKGLYEVDIEPKNFELKGKTYKEKLKNAIKDFLAVQPKHKDEKGQGNEATSH